MTDELTFYTGENTSLSLSFEQSAGVALDLTGAAVYFTAKVSTADSDDDAILDEKVTSHTDAAAGLTSIPIDLSSVTTAQRLTADVVLKDSAGAVTNYGRITLEILKSATGATDD